jgi:hypothetical protein
MEVDLWCPQCEEQVLDARTYTVGQQQHATCPQCHAELVRHPHVEDNTWKVEKSPPLADEELVSRVSGRRVLGQEQLERPEAQRLADAGWIAWGGELIWVAGFTSGGASYGLRVCDFDRADLEAMGLDVAALDDAGLLKATDKSNDCVPDDDAPF